MRTSVSALLLALLPLAAARAEEGLKSGTQVDQPLGGGASPVFSVRCIAGASAGQTYCQI